MFEITLNGKTLYHPNATDCVVSNAVIHEALNDAGYMDITLPFSNPLYDEIEEHKSKIIVYKDSVAIWYGEVRDISVDFGKNKTLYIIGEAAYLNNSIQAQRLYKSTKYNVFASLINNHNAQVEPDKRFEVGIVGQNANKDLEIVTDWEYTLDAIRNHICEEEEYFRIRHINGVRYIDIMPLQYFGKRSDQVIQFGENLLDYTEDSSGENLATVCVPLGARLDEERIEGYDNYLTCENATGQNGRNYVELSNAVNRLGRITKVVKFEDVIDPNELVTLAINYLQSAQYNELTLQLTAVDLSILYADIDDYGLGDYIRAICLPMDMDNYFPVRERQTDLINIANNSIKVGAVGYKSLTTKQAESITDLEKLIPKKDSILDQAKKNATAMLNSAGTNGHVVFRTNEDGVIYEILIMDTTDINTASKVWRWNENGFGYANSRDDNGVLKFGLAMTMDGSIVADYITSGVLRAITVNGVTINGTTINGGTINGSAITSTSAKNGSVKISGGSLIINNTSDAYLKIQSASNPRHYVTFGAEHWTVAREDQGKYKEFDPWELVKDMPSA